MAREINDLLGRAIGAIETPSDLNEQERAELLEDLTAEGERGPDPLRDAAPAMLAALKFVVERDPGLKAHDNVMKAIAAAEGRADD
jgi:hypothetical protein